MLTSSVIGSCSIDCRCSCVSTILIPHNWRCTRRYSSVSHVGFMRRLLLLSVSNESFQFDRPYQASTLVLLKHETGLSFPRPREQRPATSPCAGPRDAESTSAALLDQSPENASRRQ